MDFNTEREKCFKALERHLAIHPPSPLLSFKSAAKQQVVYSTSYRGRTGYEHEGDRQLYVGVGLGLRALFPGMESRFYDVRLLKDFVI